MGSLAKRMKRRKESAKTSRQSAEQKQFHPSPAEVLAIRKGNKQVIEETISNFFMLTKIAAHDVFGFGQDRWERLHRKMLVHMSCIGDKLVTAEEINNEILKPEAKIEFCPNKEHRKKLNHFGKLEVAVSDDMSTCLALSLLDEFGYHGKRFGKVYNRIGEIGHKLWTGEITHHDLIVMSQAIRKKRKAA